MTSGSLTCALGPGRWWLVVTANDVDLCDADPGHEVDLGVTVDLRYLTQLWRRDVRWSDALRSGTIALDGTSALRRALPKWFIPSRSASERACP